MNILSAMLSFSVASEIWAAIFFLFYYKEKKKQGKGR
jgi:hypothetical protein